MAAQVFRQGDKGAGVKALQRLFNQQAEPLFYQPLLDDGKLGPATMRAFQAIGWALGFEDKVLAAGEISVGAQALIANPDGRGPGPLQRAKARGPKLHLRTVAFDGTPTYWGLAKPLLLAREHGWAGKLDSSDRRPGVAEQFGKKSQAALFECMQRRIALGGRCPPECSGSCDDANPPGSSSHEQLSDARGFPGPVGRQLAWWELGLDVGDSDKLLAILAKLGYQVHRTYPNNPSEFHHLNLTADPGPVFAEDGATPTPQPKPVPKPTPTPKPSPAVTVTLTGPDVSLNQPDVDWVQVKGAGHAFGIAKVTDGLGSPDPAFGKARWKAMADAGLVRGAYHFGRPQKGRDPKAEVAEFLVTLKAAGGLAAGDLVPVLDIEAYGKAGKLNPAQTVDWVRVWVTELRRRVGRQPIIYTGAFWRDAMGNPADNLGCPLWLAAYVKEQELAKFVPVAWKAQGHSLWQHTSKGNCPGIAKPCDLSRFVGTQAQFDALRM
jgi:lysozyme